MPEKLAEHLSLCFGGNGELDPFALPLRERGAENGARKELSSWFCH